MEKFNGIFDCACAAPVTAEPEAHMKKRRHGGYHIQERVGSKQFFLAEGGKRVFTHREALVFLTPHDAAEHIRENELSPLWEIVLCDCPPSQW